MTILYLVRHGQASFGADDYDHLSPLGARQSALVGRHLSRRQQGLAAAFSGTMRRQVDSCAHAVAALPTLPSPRSISAFDEYDTDDLIAAYLPVIIGRDPAIAAAGANLTKDKRLFMAALSQVTHLWASGEEAPLRESWQAFRSRIKAGLELALTGRARTDEIVIFTSGGVIATTIGDILELPPAKIFALNWRLHNASISKIHFGRSGFSVDSFNTIGHLEVAADADLITYW